MPWTGGVGLVPSVLAQGSTTAPRLMGSLVRVEQSADREYELTQHPRRQQVAEHPARPESSSAVEVFGTGHQQVARLPHEVRLLLLGRPQTLAVPLLILGRPAPTTLPSAPSGELASEPSQGIEDVGIDVLDDMEDAELVAGVGPQFRQDRGVEVRAVGDDHSGQEAVIPEVVEYAPHMVPIVGPDQGEGGWEVAERVGGEQERAVPQVQFVDAQGAREVVEGPPPVAGHVGLVDLPVEAVVEEAVGQVEEEVPPHRLRQPVGAHAVVEESVEDGVADAVGVLGSWLDALDTGPERLAAGTRGAVFSNRQFDDDALPVGDVADGSRVSGLPPPGRAALGAGEGLRSTTLPENANASSAYACVLLGSEW